MTSNIHFPTGYYSGKNEIYDEISKRLKKDENPQFMDNENESEDDQNIYYDASIFLHLPGGQRGAERGHRALHQRPGRHTSDQESLLRQPLRHPPECGVQGGLRGRDGILFR